MMLHYDRGDPSNSGGGILITHRGGDTFKSGDPELFRYLEYWFCSLSNPSHKLRQGEVCTISDGPQKWGAK